jgi:hypothetical protein
MEKEKTKAQVNLKTLLKEQYRPKCLTWWQRMKSSLIASAVTVAVFPIIVGLIIYKAWSVSHGSKRRRNKNTC